MARKSTTEKLLEAQLGDVANELPRLVNTLGQSKTAVKLGVSQFTISAWLRKNGYRVEKRWVKEAPQEQK